MNRRHFIKSSAAATVAGALGTARVTTASEPPPAFTPGIHIFSKHLQFLDYADMATAAAQMGFDGVDLTVRRNGHVEPETAKRDLPRAAAAIRDAGLKTTLCVTSFNHPGDPHFEATLDAIAEAGFSHLRMGWFRFENDSHPEKQLEVHHQTARKLAEALAQRGLSGGMQNHAGSRYVGSSMWEYWKILEGIDPTVLGLQFDIRHATAERGASWRREVDVAAPKIISIIFKDHVWEKPAKDENPRLRNVPLGEGWVDWPGYAELLQHYQIEVPVSLHCEHDLGGAERGRREVTLSQVEILRRMKQDLDFARDVLSG